jgi:hypothetical protein
MLSVSVGTDLSRITLLSTYGVFQNFLIEFLCLYHTVSLTVTTMDFLSQVSQYLNNLYIPVTGPIGLCDVEDPTLSRQ